MSRVFPFDCVIVTSPDVASAASAKAPLSRLVERRLKQTYPTQSIRIVSTYDPFGARCGSGGGTLAALEYASPGDTVLVLHAGGDSSRCPTQMILGKAWTSLPCSRYRNPTIWLIDQLQLLFEHANLPKGTVVVSATDCLLTFFEGVPSSTPWDMHFDGESSVLGVAVPAELATARNHGVYIMSKEVVKRTGYGVEDPLRVWQKPTVEQLSNTQEPAPASFMVKGSATRQAWIDTGVVIFLPKAAQVLRELSGGTLALCTRSGLKEAYRQQGSKEQTMEQFAKENALKVDLYTDLLHNLSWPMRQPTEETPLRKALAPLPLRILVAPQGRFLHLGTTQELVEFVTTAAHPETEKISRTMNNEAIHALSSFLSLQPRFQCWTDPEPLDQNATLQSTFPANSTVGSSTLVEYCDLEQYESVSIGMNSMLSGWRNTTNDRTGLTIPENVFVQAVAMNEQAGGLQFVYMVLGMQDAIKAERDNCTIFGISESEFLDRTGVTLEQLGWNEATGKTDNLWNAKLHPIVPAGTAFESLYGWLFQLHQPSSVQDSPSLKKWLSSSRVSLKELHDVADAEAEWNFRQQMEVKVCQLRKEHFIPYMKNLLIERCHDKPCDLQWIIEMESRVEAYEFLLKTLLALEEVVQQELQQERYDICGRAFMIASAILSDFDVGTQQPSGVQDTEIEQYVGPLIQRLRSSSTRNISKEEKLSIVSAFVKRRIDHMKNTSEPCFGALSQVLERFSLCMNELCISQGFQKFLDPSSPDRLCATRTTEPIADKWVIAMSPARIDLAGGWTDTPPVCYEFGGSVTGMAVLVDDHMPLSCRCRILPGKTGVYLRTEHRDNVDGSLLSFNSVEVSAISDLSDFRNPLSNCALIKAALVCLGMVTEDQIEGECKLQPLVNDFCSSSEDVRIEIVTASLLPHGSGMGTSSILGSCVLADVAKCVGIGELGVDYLIHAVLMLEQLLSTGGGWQDQAQGIVQGLKTVRSNPAELPLVVSVEQLNVDPSTIFRFEKRMVLVFTGKTRLAKNILQDVLRRWARRTHEIVATVSRKRELSEDCRVALIDGDVGKLAHVVNEVAKVKVVMTGEDSGAIPKSVKLLVDELKSRDAIKGACLCGAGGGGFLLMVASDGYQKEQLSDFVSKELVPLNSELADFTWHDCRICPNGLTVRSIDEGVLGLDDFELDWQKVKP